MQMYEEYQQFIVHLNKIFVFYQRKNIFFRITLLVVIEVKQKD